MNDPDLIKAAESIRSGDIILYPTDTIWGIGCDATNSESVRKIYQIKQRADHKSMLILVNSISMMEEYLETFPRLASDIYKNAEKPCTIIFPGAKNLATNLVAPDGTIGIRLTSDPFCKKLIGLSAVPLVSTSANISGSAAPATFHEINSSICEQVDYIVKWRQDDTSPAKPSSIIKLEKDGSITTLRP